MASRPTCFPTGGAILQSLHTKTGLAGRTCPVSLIKEQGPNNSLLHTTHVRTYTHIGVYICVCEREREREREREGERGRGKEGSRETREGEREIRG